MVRNLSGAEAARFNALPVGLPAGTGGFSFDDAAHQAVGGNQQNLVTDQAVNGWLKYSIGLPVAKNEHEALAALGYSPTAGEIKIDLPEHPPLSGPALSRVRAGADFSTILNAQSVGSDTAGGFLVSEGFVRSLEIALLAYSAMLQSSTILRTATGEDLPYPTVDDTDNSGELLEENTEAAEQDISFGSRKFFSYTYSSKIVKVSNQLMRDASINVGSVVGGLLGTRIGRIVNSHFTTGDAASKPEGIVEGATLGVTAASATAIAPDEIIDLVHSIDPAYRTMGCSFMMHDSIFSEISQLKDSDNNYLVGNLQDGARPTLRGWPVVFNPAMASTIASSAKTILFGQLSKYLVRQVGTLVVRKLVERYAEYNQTGFIAFSDFDGGLLDAGTNPVKYLQMAAA
ncbi:MAG: phage major capsid protein [Planctomycetota bacterium]